MLRGDHELNEVKASKLAGLKDGFRFASEAEIVEHFGGRLWLESVPGEGATFSFELPLASAAAMQ